MGKHIAVTIPYKRQSFNPQVAAYLHAVERMADDYVEQSKPQLQQAMLDLIVYGTATIRVPTTR